MDMARHLISLADLTNDEIAHLVSRGRDYATEQRPIQETLRGRVVGIYFRKTSTRTRTAFSSAVLRLGGQVITYGPHDLQTNTGETYQDTGRVLSGMLDAFVARTASDPEELRALGIQQRMPIINAMTADEHPTQAIADLTTLLQHFGKIEGTRVLYVGEGNNTAAALCLALARFPGAELHLRTPPGYGVATDKLQLAAREAQRHGSHVEERHDLDDLPIEIDAVYTTRWQTTGTDKEDPNWRSVFRPFQVNERLMDHWPNALFMHDLPAHRGEEVTEEVIDGPRSITFSQAENKYRSAVAVMEWCMSGRQ